ncbi:MAG: hypothetical protein JWQ36_2803 [Enterovirga sp.]|jgi:hypothetical protein|nr:hypothetical protein [Enterovirga sp.]
MHQDGDRDWRSGVGANVIDLADRVRTREQKLARPEPERVAYSLFLLVSRAPQLRDHALFYLFLEGAPTMVAVASFAREHADLFGSDVSIIDLKEPYENPMEVVEKARNLRLSVAGATVLAPDLGLGPRLVRNG